MKNNFYIMVIWLIFCILTELIELPVRLLELIKTYFNNPTFWKNIQLRLSFPVELLVSLAYWIIAGIIIMVLFKLISYCAKKIKSSNNNEIIISDNITAFDNKALKSLKAIAFMSLLLPLILIWVFLILFYGKTMIWPPKSTLDFMLKTIPLDIFKTFVFSCSVIFYLWYKTVFRLKSNPILYKWLKVWRKNGDNNA